ncbi:MAG: metallophosphoesterase [Kofleriaceae bacterium]
MRRGWIAFALVAACAPDASVPPVVAAPAPAVVVDAAVPVAEPWTFAVISDLHLPNVRAATVRDAVAALIAERVRFVVIAGDSTNGSEHDYRIGAAMEWWHEVTMALRPLRDAGIGVLPVAGNHDSYLAWQRASYAKAFEDLAGWAGSLAIHSTGSGLAAAPFSYSIDVDGVHLALAHITSQALEPDVAAWLAQDLATAATARHRIVLAHVPLVSVIQPPSSSLLRTLGKILERGRVELYVAGHEHLVWDERIALPGGGSLREVIAGCASGFYNYAPSDDAKRRAGCVAVVEPGRREPMRCAMPNGGGVFTISRGRKNRHVQHDRSALVLVTVDGDDLRVRPMTIEGGKLRPFYLAE